MTLEVGQVLRGKYRVDRLIGRGRVGAVYRAQELSGDRRVAIRVVHAGREAVSANWEREARLASATGNAHILEVFDHLVLPGGLRCTVTEYLEGETLRARMSRVGNMTEAEVAGWLVQALEGLGAAHRAGVFHRDLTPASLLVLPFQAGHRDFVKIIDFGLSEPSSTQGEILGVETSPLYRAPERVLQDSEPDARSNVYSLAVMAYEALTGALPFAAETLDDYVRELALRRPMPIAEKAPWLGSVLGDIVDQALATQPEARFQSTRAMLAATVNWAQGIGIALTLLETGESEPTPQRAPPTNSQPRPRAPAAGEPLASKPPPVAASNARRQPRAPATPLASNPPAVAPPGSHGKNGASVAAIAPASTRPAETAPKQQQQTRASAGVTPSASTPPPLPTRERPTERSPVVVAVSHPLKPHVEQAPEALVVIEEARGSDATQERSRPTLGVAATLPAIRPEAPHRPGRRWLLVVLLLALMLGVGSAAWLGKLPWGAESLSPTPQSGALASTAVASPVRVPLEAATNGVSSADGQGRNEETPSSAVSAEPSQAKGVASGAGEPAADPSSAAGTPEQGSGVPRPSPVGEKTNRPTRSTRPKSTSAATPSERTGPSKAGPNNNPYAYR